MEGRSPILVEGACIGNIGISGGAWGQDEAITRQAVAAIRSAG